MIETWRPTRHARILNFWEPLFSLLILILLTSFLWHPWRGDAEDDHLGTSTLFYILILMPFMVDLLSSSYNLYLMCRRRMFFWSMTFDSDALTILRPDESPLTVHKADCARLYPISGKLILRDGRAVHLCTPEEKFVDCPTRARWLEEWWPGLHRIARDIRRNTKNIQVGALLASLLAAMFVVFGSVIMILETSLDSVWGVLLLGALLAVVYAGPKIIYTTDWYQQPIDLDRLPQDRTALDTLQRT